MPEFTAPSGNKIRTYYTDAGHMVHEVDSGVEGANLLVTGAIHGNEICGPQAITRALNEFLSGKNKLNSGTVTFVPICNMGAFTAGKRYIDENMNRIFKHYDRPQNREQEMVNALLPLFENKTHFLDLHSVPKTETASPSVPFIFNDQETEKSRGIARAIGVPYIVEGWAKLYPPINIHEIIPAEPDTLWYAKSRGVAGVLVECGDHDYPHADSIAAQAIHNMLVHAGMMNAELIVPKNSPKIVTMTELVRRPESKSFQFIGEIGNFTSVTKGQLIATFEGAGVTELRAPHDGVVVVPWAGAPVGQEMIYFGRLEAA